MAKNPTDKLMRKMAINVKINESQSREEVLSQELGQLLDREETWDKSDIQHAQRLNEMIDAEKELQKNLRRELAMIDRESD